ncbi:repeatmulti-domain protein, partial [Pyrenophora tritici-repentis]
MPIFHDPNDSPPAPSYLAHTSPTNLERGGATRLDSEDDWGNAMRQEEALTAQRSLEVDVESSTHTRKPSMFGRNEWIERIKKTNSPSWLQWQGTDIANHGPIPPRPTSGDRPSLPRTPSTELQASRTSTPDHVRDAAAAGLDIQRPRSALHSGDFREQRAATATDHGHSSAGFVATSPVVPWDRSFPAAGYPTRTSHVQYSEPSNDDTRTVARARATSHSSHSQFTLLPPTSPLVYQANNTGLDFSSGPSSRKNSPSPDRNNRRHTFTPPSFQPYQSIQMARSATGTPAARHLRHGTSLPYQAHQPRRSMTNNISEPYSLTHTPYLSPRRPSFSSEASPLQHAPMVGSYEESILRGRMSTTPSRPLDFVAKIGVLGRGDCKSSLRCPPHVTVPFPAVFYSYNTGNGRISDNEPSPYVGLIDLENSLPAPDESKESGKRKRRHAVPPPDQDDLDFRIHLGDEESLQTTKGNLRRKEKKKRRSTLPKAPPGGCYRIPPQGQLQIVLKNPNKTAVKLFLVPYDLSDMEPGQKTFIRQRSYSAGPIIDMPSSSRKNLGTDCPEAALSSSDDPNDRPILRYLIHLHICCPSKGRHYLYKSIRVVFANRVPDGKEKLRNEIQQPEPRYSTYKPTRDSMASQKTQSSGPQLTDKVSRRRSAGWPLSHSQQAYDALDNIRQHTPLPPPTVKFTGDNANSSASSSFSSHVADLQPIPFALSRLAAIQSQPVSRECMDVDPKSPFRTPVTSPRPVVSPNSSNDGTFEKLSKGDIG